jgi:hypothetical protein
MPPTLFLTQLPVEDGFVFTMPLALWNNRTIPSLIAWRDLSFIWRDEYEFYRADDAPCFHAAPPAKIAGGQSQ